MSNSDKNGESQSGTLPADARILVVEDNLVIGLDLEEILSEFGVNQVMLAQSVEEALEIIEAGDLTMALLDLRLADDTTSLPVAQALAAADIPFVFTSGYSRWLELPDYLASVPVLTKPIVTAGLRETVMRILTGNDVRSS